MEQLIISLAGALVVFGIIMRIVGAAANAILKPPLSIQLVPIDDRAKGRFADSHRRELESLGFTTIGIYKVREMKGVTLVAFANAAKAVCAVVYRHPLAGVFVDMVSVSENDRGLTVTNAPVGGNLDQPPGRAKAFVPKGSVGALLERLLAERPAGPYQRLDASNFVRVFQSEYAREMQWRKDRGGPTPDEVRREAHAMGIHSEATIQKATEQLREQYREPTHPGVR